MEKSLKKPVSHEDNQLLLSVCMIVKNEALILSRCLQSVCTVADEIVVVDTGSTDDTVSIAQSFGARVIYSSWKNDFSYSRNLSIDNASGKWIVWMDADDILPKESIDHLRALKRRPPVSVYAFIVKNEKGGGTGSEFVQARMFPNRPDIRFERRIHEQIMPSALRIGLSMVASEVVVEHHGYADPLELQQKATRNLTLLLEDYLSNSGDQFMAVEIADSYFLIEDFANASIWYNKVLAIDSCEKSTPAIASQAYFGLGNIESKNRQFNAALLLLNKAVILTPWRVDVLYSLAVALDLSSDVKGSIDVLKQIIALAPTPGMVGVDFRAAKLKSFLRLLRIYRENELFTDAFNVGNDALTIFSDRPEIYNAVALVYYLSGDLLHALRLFEKSMLLRSDGNLDALIGFYLIFKKAGKVDRALEMIQNLASTLYYSPRYFAFCKKVSLSVSIPIPFSNEKISDEISLLAKEYPGDF